MSRIGRRVRAAVNPVSTAATRWWCHSALRHMLTGYGPTARQRRFIRRGMAPEPPDQHVNPAEEPSPPSSPSRPEDPAADGTAFLPGVPRAPASRIRIRPQVTRIGRHPGNDIVVADLGVSKQHAELRRSPAGRYSIIDLGSHHGTYVNGTRVSRQELNEGDIIAIGPAAFRLAHGKLIEDAGDGADAELLA